MATYKLYKKALGTIWLNTKDILKGGRTYRTKYLSIKISIPGTNKSLKLVAFASGKDKNGTNEKYPDFLVYPSKTDDTEKFFKILADTLLQSGLAEPPVKSSDEIEGEKLSDEDYFSAN